MAMTYQPSQPPQPSSRPPAPSRAIRVTVYTLLGLLALVVILGVVLSSGDDPAPAEPEDRSVMAGVQCEEAVNQRLRNAEPETTRTERDGDRYTVGGFVADGQAYVCEITDKGGGRWTVTSLMLGGDYLLGG